ncbi:hypothetical protein HWV62_33994 [Athelia sp. TMB]|nr:hypothetical protein HWV62_33994 [Athelia sp. TMB]
MSPVRLSTPVMDLAFVVHKVAKGIKLVYPDASEINRDLERIREDLSWMTPKEIMFIADNASDWQWFAEEHDRLSSQSELLLERYPGRFDKLNNEYRRELRNLKTRVKRMKTKARMASMEVRIRVRSSSIPETRSSTGPAGDDPVQEIDSAEFEQLLLESFTNIARSGLTTEQTLDLLGYIETLSQEATSSTAQSSARGSDLSVPSIYPTETQIFVTLATDDSSDDVSDLHSSSDEGTPRQDSGEEATSSTAQPSAQGSDLSMPSMDPTEAQMSAILATDDSSDDVSDLDFSPDEGTPRQDSGESASL